MLVAKSTTSRLLQKLPAPARALALGQYVKHNHVAVDAGLARKEQPLIRKVKVGDTPSRAPSRQRKRASNSKAPPAPDEPPYIRAKGLQLSAAPPGYNIVKQRGGGHQVAKVLLPQRYTHEDAPGTNRQLMITTRTPQTVTQKDILKTLQELYQETDIIDYGIRPALAVLATPSFTLWLEDTAFMSKVVGIVCGRRDLTGSGSLKASSLFAVVDSLPPKPEDFNSVTLPLENNMSPEDADLASFGFKPYTGMVEGFAFMHGDHKRFLPSLFGENKLDSSKKGSLVFSFLDIGSVDTQSTFIRVPLANTLFRNGTPSTLMVSSWERSSPTEPFKNTSTHRKSVQRVRLSGSRRPNPPLVTTPLVCLTPGRKVVNSMGNIVRQITDANGEPQPASRELEDAVHGYLKARELDRQKVSVWALVTPTEQQLENPIKDSESKEKVNRKTQEFLSDNKATNAGILPYGGNSSLEFWLNHGARLYRVVSGGGGWGPKAGLLSLDPQHQFDMPESARFDFDSINSLKEDSGSPAKNLFEHARPGSLIQFWISLETPVEPKMTSKIAAVDQSLPANEGTFLFGCVPSTIDDIPTSPSPSLTQDSDGAGLSVHLDYFGAQSEEALYLDSRVLVKSKAKKPSKRRQGRLSTKMDVPYGLVSVGFEKVASETMD